MFITNLFSKHSLRSIYVLLSPTLRNLGINFALLPPSWDRLGPKVSLELRPRFADWQHMGFKIVLKTKIISAFPKLMYCSAYSSVSVVSPFYYSSSSLLLAFSAASWRQLLHSSQYTSPSTRRFNIHLVVFTFQITIFSIWETLFSNIRFCVFAFRG